MSSARKKGAAVGALAFVSFIAIAGAIVTIDSRTASYSGIPSTQGLTNKDDEEARSAGDTALAARYRTLHGSDTLPAGSVFKVIYSDGGGENAGVTSPYSSMGSAPIPGTQFDANTTCYFQVNCDQWGQFG